MILQVVTIGTLVVVLWSVYTIQRTTNKLNELIERHNSLAEDHMLSNQALEILCDKALGDNE